MKCKFRHVECEIGENSVVRKCTIISKKNGKIVIGNNCSLKYTVFSFFGEDGKIAIGDHVTINARPEALTKLGVSSRSVISIGNQCLFSNMIDIATTDWHTVCNEQGEKINYDKDVFIGKHVWIGRKVLVGKSVSINENSIIAAGSVVTKPILESNVMIAGNPAVIKKHNVNWK